ncbi:MAG: hypothetical protein WAW86_00250 [Gammaproteobacteria bacterium]
MTAKLPERPKNIHKNKLIPAMSEQDRQNEAIAANIRRERENQRRSEQSTADIMKAMQKNQGPKQQAELMPKAASKEKIQQIQIDSIDLSLISDPKERMRAIRKEREQDRRAEQSRLDKEKTGAVKPSFKM